MLGLLSGLMLLVAGATPTATITIDCDHPGIAVSPSLYGIFFEEINCAGDGGLYAELVRNRSFEDPEPLGHWSLREEGGAKGTMAVATDDAMPPQNPHVLTLSNRAESGKVFAVNEGYWGFGLTQGQKYHVTLRARAADGYTGGLSFAFTKDGFGDMGSARAVKLDSAWRTCEGDIVATGTAVAQHFSVGIEGKGTVYLDMVSVMPVDTFPSASPTQHIRKDLGGMLNDLKPSFMRFPGGCWVEGDTLDLAMRWKTTIGDLAARRTQHNIWQYESTNGLGYHEYLQLCEDLGAEPLFVINCGMSHHGNVPMDQMGEWVQDALDAIEYANGGEDTPWGRRRAENGHARPFGLKMMEIGNENGGSAYQERYALFYDAIKARYPEMKLIANERTTSRPADIVDEHYYSTPEFFLANADKYDTYDRNGPKIYVGEYAVTQDCGQGNLRAALAEAAFMMGMERNSDVVTMSSYAPLFANVNYKKWNPDLINFDASRAYGTPSYYVQKMFSEMRLEHILPLKLEMEESAETVTRHGGIGVGTWATQAEYKDLSVTKDGKTLYSGGKEADWKLGRGKWETSKGALQQASAELDCRATAGDTAWSDYTYTLKARKTSGSEGFLILFHVQDDNNWVWWNLGGWGNTKHALERCDGGNKSLLGNEVPGQIETGKWYDIRIETQGDHIRCYLDGKLLHDVTYPRLKPIYAVAGTRLNEAGPGKTTESGLIVKIVNFSDKERTLNIQPIAGRLLFTGDTRLSTKRFDSKVDNYWENTLDQPTNVAPNPVFVEGPPSKEFETTLHPQSLAILSFITSSSLP